MPWFFFRKFYLQQPNLCNRYVLFDIKLLIQKETIDTKRNDDLQIKNVNFLKKKLKIDGSWGAWSAWGTCSVSCGGGTQSRSRLCDSPAPSGGGAACPGSSSENSTCNNQICVIG